MCLIIVKRKGEKFKEKWFKSGWNSNPDGAGFMYAVDGEIKVYKSMFEHDVLNEFNRVNSLYCNTTDIIIHFRWGTHGLKNIENVHPFKVSEKLWFCHNGVFRINCDSNKDISDTQHFNQQCLMGLPEGFLNNKSICDLLEEYCLSSKLAFLDETGKSYILNKQLGCEHCGNWFSNTYFKEYKRVYTPKHYYGGRFNYDDEYSEVYEDGKTWYERNYGVYNPPTVNKVETDTSTKVIDVKEEDESHLAEIIQLSNAQNNGHLLLEDSSKEKKDSEDMYDYLNRIN